MTCDPVNMSKRMDFSNPDNINLYIYEPDKAAPTLFAILIGISLILHTWQNFRYHFHRVTFFLIYANLVFVVGWILRSIVATNPQYLSNTSLYIGQTVFIYAGPPIYAAAEYNILGRLMHYLPMHAPLHPHRTTIFFIYLGALVEALTGAGAASMASTEPGSDKWKRGGLLLSISLVLQAGVEMVYVSIVSLVHYRVYKSGMLRRNVNTICITLYGCSTLVLIRCIFRAIEAFGKYTDTCAKGSCDAFFTKEWFLYVLDAAPMLLYTFWLNVFHPGRFMPADRKRYLDLDATTERMGPGWIDERAAWKTFVDPFNFAKDPGADSERTRFWGRPQDWQMCNGSFTMGTASNQTGKRKYQTEEIGKN